MRKNWIVPLFLSLCFFVFLIVKSERGVRLDLQARGDSFIEGVKIVHKKNGIADWVLTARRADIVKGGDEAVLQDLRLTMQDKALTINAGQGVYNLINKNIDIIGKITAEGRHFTMSTADISFDNDADVMKTNAPVRIEGEKYVLQGKGLQADTGEQKMRILKDVTATFYR